MKSTLFGKLDVILLDIEGTTTPIDFVYNTLFPYARANMASYITTHWGEEAVQRDISLTLEQARHDREQGDDVPFHEERSTEVTPQRAVAMLTWYMDNDRKITGLKNLQGKIWRGGYESGAIKAQVYEDVVRLFEQVARDAEARLCIYSSGSVEAQKLLFGYSEHGDLMPHISGYYDTTTGPKKEVASYLAIAGDLGVSPSRVLFLTDHIDEARAAREAGMQVGIAMREGNAVLPEHHSFEEISRFDNLLS